MLTSLTSTIILCNFTLLSHFFLLLLLLVVVVYFLNDCYCLILLVISVVFYLFCITFYFKVFVFVSQYTVKHFELELKDAK